MCDTQIRNLTRGTAGRNPPPKKKQTQLWDELRGNSCEVEAYKQIDSEAGRLESPDKLCQNIR